MKTIKIMIAASEELHKEILVFTSLIEHLNDVLAPRGIELKRIKWNSETDGTLATFQDKLCDCEMCLTLYWCDLARNSLEELNTAYQELKSGNNPQKLYVFFKEPADDISEALQDFKANFVTTYGHFYCVFENVDTMNLHFILQLEAYQNSLNNDLVQITEGKVLVAGQEMVNLDNIPFASMNDEYKRMQHELLELDAKVAKLCAQYAVNAGNKELLRQITSVSSQREKVKEKFEKYQKHLYDIALNFAKHSNEQYSERMKMARDLFERGNNVEADLILNLEAMKGEAEKELLLFEQNRKVLGIKIEEFRLKADTVMANTSLSITDRYSQACEAYEEAIRIADEIRYDEKAFAEIIFDYATRLMELNRVEESAKYYLKTLGKQRRLLRESSVFLPDIATTLNNLAIQEEALGFFKQAEESFKEAINIRRQLADSDPNTYLYDYARVLNNFAGLQLKNEHYEEAEKNYNEALKVLMQLADATSDAYLPDISMTLSNLAVLQEKLGHYKEAEKGYMEALKIRRQLNENTDMYWLEIADSLNNLAGLHMKLGHYENAENCYGEALGITQHLSEAAPDIYLPKEAMILSNCASLFHTLGRLEEAEEYYIEAQQIYDELADIQPMVYMPYLADIMCKSAHLLFDLCCYEDALEAYDLALCIYRDLSEENPKVYLREVAATLNDRANVQQYIKRYEEAEESYEEALDFYRRMSITYPETYLPLLANILDNLALLKHEMDCYEEARRGFDEALTIRKNLSEVYPEVFLPEVAKTLSHIAILHYKQSQYDEAVRNNEDALEIYRHLAETHPEVYLFDVAGALNDIACMKEKQGLLEETVDLLFAALDICEKLEPSTPKSERLIERIYYHLNLIKEELDEDN